MDPRLHRVSSQEASGISWGSGGVGVRELAGGAAPGQRVDAEPGAQCRAVPISGCARHRAPGAAASAATDWRWRFVFPAARICRDPRFGPPSRYHLHESAVQKAVAQAARAAEITKRVGPHTLRHCFATHLLEAGYDIRTVQALLGHRDVRTTMTYLHVMQKGALGVKSPVDRL